MHHYTTLAGQIYEIEELNWIKYLILPASDCALKRMIESDENYWTDRWASVLLAHICAINTLQL